MAKLTPKQERFCQKYIELGNASEAYRQSYDCKNMKPESVNRLAKDLLDNIKITSRLKELQTKHAKRHDITVDTLLDELEQVRVLALAQDVWENGEASKPQLNVAVNAIMGKAKLLGLDKQVIEQTGDSTINIKVKYE